MLITGEEGDAWYHAATRIAQEHGVPLKAIRVSSFAGDWLRQREIAADGAVLVRPDRVVAWRALGSSAQPQEALEQALDQILGARQAAFDCA